jgi:hypothetical protein
MRGDTLRNAPQPFSGAGAITQGQQQNCYAKGVGEFWNWLNSLKYFPERFTLRARKWFCTRDAFIKKAA